MDVNDPQWSFETLAYSATEAKKLVDLAGEAGAVHCLPTEVCWSCRCFLVPLVLNDSFNFP